MAEMQPVIGFNSTVVMHSTITLEDGTVADTTVGAEPLRFTMGDGSLIAGLELALFGLKAGDRQSLRIGPADAFGFRDEQNVHWMERAEFPADMTLETGMIIEFVTPSGEEIPGAIQEVREDSVQVDFNHPLAGHEISFEVEILEVTSDE